MNTKRLDLTLLFAMTLSAWSGTPSSVAAQTLLPLPGERFLPNATPFIPVGPGASQVDVQPSAIVVGPGDEVFVRDSASIKVFTSAGAFVRGWTCAANFSDVSNLYGALALFGNTVLAQCGSGPLQRFSTTGTPTGTIAPAGSATGQVTFVTDLAVLPDGRLVVADAGRGRVLVFSAAGAFTHEWGSYAPASVPPPANAELRVAATATNRVIVYVQGTASVFTADGDPSPTPALFSPCTPTSIELLRGRVFWGCFAISGTGQSLHESIVYELDSEGESILGFGRSGGTNIIALAPLRFSDVAMLSSGDLVVAGPRSGSRGVRRFARVHRTPRPAAAPAIPDVELTAIAPRPGTTLVDVDYVVRDADSASVGVAALVFRTGAESPQNLVRMQALLEGTASNVGAAIPTNAAKRLTWDALADLGAGSGIEDVTFHVIAHDGGNLVDADFMTLPAGFPGAGDPLLEISRTRIAPGDLAEVWMWLVACSDAGVTLTGATVQGTGAAAGTVYVTSNGTITPEGLSYLLGRLGWRVATLAEVQRARAGTTPGEQTTPPLYQIAQAPIKQNEIGFDFGDPNDAEPVHDNAQYGIYVVPLP